MFDWVPLAYYTSVFYNVLFVVVLFTCLKTLTEGSVINKKSIQTFNALVLMLVVILYMGLRPVSGRYFGDMATYNRLFEYYASGGEIISVKDYAWQLFMQFCSGIMNAETFFLICAGLYVLPLYKACDTWFKGDKYVVFLMFIASFSFWAYGTNGIRNGIATSLLVWALSLNKKKVFKYGLFVLSFLFHSSLIVPLSAFILTSFYKNPKTYYRGWLICIPISLVLGSASETFIANLGIFDDDRVEYLIQGNINNDSFAYTGFRWDFLVYSAFAVYAGYYFIIKRSFKDDFYIQLFNLYVTVNAFWILVIRANFSNRFAYLSWFLMAVVIFYPFLKQRFFKYQQKVLIYTMLGYFGFSYFMFLLKQ